MNASNFGGNFPRIFEGTATNAFQVYLSGGTLTVSQNGGSTLFTYALTGLTNQWLHICVTRNSANSQMRLFINGVLRGYTASGGTNFATSTTWQSANEGGGIVGYLSNMRVVRGFIPVEYQTSVTTTGTSVFTPPTQLFNVPGTSFLTCNSPAIIDQSNNAYAITPAGDVRVTTFTPFTAYVPYNPALGASTPGVWTLDEALQAKGTRQWNMYDPSFNLTTLLLHGNGANNAQNNTFLDSSSNNFSITRNPASGPNAPTQGSFSPFSQTGWSNYFGGSANYFTAGVAADWQFLNSGASNYTIEAFLYVSSVTAQQFICATNAAGASIGINFQITSGSKLTLEFTRGVVSSFATFTSTGNVIANAWNYVAVTFETSGKTATFYINGSLAGSSSNTGYAYSTSNPSNTLNIAREPSGTGYLTGYIASLRISNTLRTISSTPTSAFSSDANTVLLTCQSNRFVDNSGTPKTITISGAPSVQPFSPFYSTAAYTPATVGGSVFLDGTSDYLSIADNAAFDFGSGDFTISAWIYPTTSGGAIIDQGGGGTSTNRSFEIFMSGPSTIANAYITSGGSYQSQYNLTGTTTPYAWNFIEFTRSSGTIYLFVNGVQQSSASANITVYNSTANVFIGDTSQATGNNFRGYISDVRVRKGTGASSSTVPTAPLTNVSNTVLLCNFTNAGIVDSTAKNVLETVGNAQISTTQSKFGGTSMYFDGNGDNLLTTPSQVFDLGASDFTIEFWLYPVSTSAGTLVYSTSNRVKTDALAIILSGGNVLGYATPSGGSVWGIMSAGNFGSVTINTWSHVALVRNGSSFRGYVNGVQSASLATTSSAITSFNGFSIGSNGAAADFLNGYIDDLRITRFARYIAAFTPQTSQWQDE